MPLASGDGLTITNDDLFLNHGSQVDIDAWAVPGKKQHAGLRPDDEETSRTAAAAQT